MGIKYSYHYLLLDTAHDVDGQTWHTVVLSGDAGRWMRDTYPGEKGFTWYEHLATDINQDLLDITDEIYTALALRWA